ncbi:hypothetical protein BCR42DRAFT_432985 [Absidia repens]|uniref:Uncharacterized protein n=1 Tax=Absidia repens TaxID=90262 RepID=A0A1X2IW70_9FUNG|nr:hypothetical protein BCR42DRAFT_432985 [Absidia repens]
MVFGFNYDRSTPASTATTTTVKTNSFKQHFKRWLGWRPKKSQQNIPSAQYNNYLMISSCTDGSIHRCPSAIPNNDQSTIFETTQPDTNALQQLQQQKPYDEGLARLSNCTTEFSHLDNTLHTGSYSSRKAASANQRRPALIDTDIARHKATASSTYSHLTGPLTTSAFSDMTNSAETSPVSTNSVQQALPLSPSWDQELQEGRDASLIDSDVSTLSNSLSDIGSTLYAQPNVRDNDGVNKQLVYEWLSDSENEDDSNNDPSFFHDNATTASQYSLLLKRRSIPDGSSATHQDTNEPTPTTTASPSFIDNYVIQHADYDYHDISPLENAASMDDPGSTTSFFTTNSRFSQQDLDESNEAPQSSVYSTPFASSSLDTDTMLLVTHAVNFLKSREDSNWDGDNNDNSNVAAWPYTQSTCMNPSSTTTKTSSMKPLNDEITPSPSTSTASTLVPSGCQKITSLMQDKNINGISDRRETTDEEFHRIVSTHVLF